MDQNATTQILRYHQASKHHPDRYARSPMYMDWENQPHPFRFYDGADPQRLPLLKADPAGSHLDLYRRRKHAPQNLKIENLAGFLELSLGLSAWKGISESQWALRMNPSSGNLHPTEAYLIVPEIGGLKSGLYHYHSFLHALEARCLLPRHAWEQVGRQFQSGCFFVALSSIFWREAWKYGERAYRYCHHDIGHAVACLSFSGSLFGWRITCLAELSDRQLETVLGFDRTDFPDFEHEQAQLICVVHDHGLKNIPRALPSCLAAALSEAAFSGKPNRLSRSALEWEAIERAVDCTRKPQTEKRMPHLGRRAYFEGTPSGFSAAQIIRKRRSALAFNPDAQLSRDRFFSMLDKTLPRDQQAPFDVEISEPCLDLLLFVHGVSDMEQGLYFFARTENRMQDLKSRLDPQFLWQPAAAELPLFLLKKDNYRRTAQFVSCDQEIAGRGAFSLGMIAHFRAVIEREPYRYRLLFWEAGIVGQVLYLEAEAAGMRGTGIGCFFDDEVHDVLGLKSDLYQSLYHFTVGEPREDRRLQTLAPYHHFKPQARVNPKSD